MRDRARDVVKAPISFPVEVAGYRESNDSAKYRAGLLEDTTFAPYQPGTVVWFWTRGEVRLGRVQKVDSIYLMEHGHHIPKYKVQIATKDGYWAGQTETVYPDLIKRAYFVARYLDEPRDLPTLVEGLDRIEQVRRDS
jgi:hypothetical protein